VKNESNGFWNVLQLIMFYVMIVQHCTLINIYGYGDNGIMEERLKATIGNCCFRGMKQGISYLSLRETKSIMQPELHNVHLSIDSSDIFEKNSKENQITDLNVEQGTGIFHDVRQ
jgi:hypothetical protein